ncbi:MAG TPA: hypothetical protein VN920_13760 [Pyrinomonadaceae bacterium]|nr:hypothetical protein [Pyrinomonadaceae bacterium]
MRFSLPKILRLRLISTIVLTLLVIGIEAHAQSSDVRFPTPVSSSEIVDSIAARDLGDSRLTDYFYTFTGVPGDLLITLESRNLNGDLDIFTAGELRPLLKITFYAESTTSSSKNIYLRKRESLILRVEARTPNDDPGTYRIRFNGSFEPISGGSLVADSERPAETNKDLGKTSDRKTTRVSSVGARIEEPPEEVAAAPTAKPAPEATPSPEKSTRKEPARNSTAKTVGGRRLPPRNRTRPSAPSETARDTEKDPAKASGNDKPAEAATKKPRKTESSEAATATDKSAGEEGEKKTEDAESKPAPTRRAGVRRNSARTPRAPQPESNARLVIEEKNGTRREFLMSNVRKVTVENGEIVVVAIDGFTQRISMAKVARMSIGP